MAINFVGDNDHGDAKIDFTEPLMQELWDRRLDATEMKAKIERLTKERDQARREMSSAITRNRIDTDTAMQRANELSRCDKHPSKAFKDVYSMQYATERGWDCFHMVDIIPLDNSVSTSHKNIINKHNDLFQKLAQDEKTNG